MSRPTLSLPVRQLDLFRNTTPAAAGSVRAAALPSAANSLTADARRQGGSRGPVSVLVILKRRRPVGSWLDYPDSREPAMSAEDRACMSERERAYQGVQ